MWSDLRGGAPVREKVVVLNLSLAAASIKQAHLAGDGGGVMDGAGVRGGGGAALVRRSAAAMKMADLTSGTFCRCERKWASSVFCFFLLKILKGV